MACFKLSVNLSYETEIAVFKGLVDELIEHVSLTRNAYCDVISVFKHGYNDKLRRALEGVKRVYSLRGNNLCGPFYDALKRIVFSNGVKIIDKEYDAKWSDPRLMRHQNAVVSFCRDLEKDSSETVTECMERFVAKDYGGICHCCKFNFLLNDDVGSGKTFQVCGIIMAGHEKESNLIAVPHKIIKQWKDTLDKLGLTYRCVESTSSVLENIDKDYRITLVSSTMFYKYQASVSKGKRFDRVFIDEMNTIKGVIYKFDLSYRYGYFVTANTSFRYPPKCPKMDYTVRSDPAFVKESIKLPSYKTIRYKARLHPLQEYCYKHKIPLDTAWINNFNVGTYDAVDGHKVKEMLLQNKREKIVEYQQRTRALMNEKQGVERSLKENPRCEQCESVVCDCVNRIKQRIVHCEKSISVINKEIKALDKFNVNAKSSGNQANSSENILNGIIDSKGDAGFKMLVYTNVTQKLRVLLDSLQFLYPDIYIDIVGGKCSSVEKMLAKAQETQQCVLLADATTTAAGLNMPFLTDVVLFNEMKEDLEQQIIGRGQRYGRVGRLTVHRCINQ